MSIVILIAAAFATWRISRMIALEEGPFSIFSWVRGHLDPLQTSWLGRGISCVFCISFWVALFLAVLIAYFPGELTNIIVATFAISGGAMLIHRWSA